MSGRLCRAARGGRHVLHKGRSHVDSGLKTELGVLLRFWLDLGTLTFLGVYMNYKTGSEVSQVTVQGLRFMV